MLNDSAIRRSVHEEILRESPGALIVDEASLFGSIADVLVPSELHAFEIKSQLDDLRRLPRQASALERTFPLVTLVTAASHADKAKALVDESWGMWIATPTADGVRIERRREATAHAALRPTWMFGALRSDELRLIAMANRLPTSGTRNDIVLRLLRHLGSATCVRLARQSLSVPTRWCDVHGPRVAPVLSAMEMSLFPLPAHHASSCASSVAT